jgi:hypothetical protein
VLFAFAVVAVLALERVSLLAEVDGDERFGEFDTI